MVSVGDAGNAPGHFPTETGRHAQWWYTGVTLRVTGVLRLPCTNVLRKAVASICNALKNVKETITPSNQSGTASAEIPAEHGTRVPQCGRADLPAGRLLEAISKPVRTAEGAHRGSWGHSLSSAETTCQSSGVGGGTLLSTWRRRGMDRI